MMKTAIHTKLIVLLVSTAVFFLAFIWFLCVWPMYGPSITKEKAMGRFERQTGISIADEMAILGFKNDHGSMNGDGEFGMVVTMPPVRIATILRGPPPFGKSWRNGPVAGEIGCHCAFIYAESPGAETTQNTPPQYFGGSPEVGALLSSTDVIYCAQSRGPASIPWNNGTLLVVRPSDGTLWLSEWDF